MAATQTSFKNARTRRIMQVESGFQLGCYYTNQEIPTGYGKLLVNYDYSDDGSILRPRMGITNDAVLKHSDVDTTSTETVTLGDATVDGLLYFNTKDDTNELIECVLSFGNSYLFGSTDQNIPQDNYYNPNIDVTNGSIISRGSSGWVMVLDKRDEKKYATNPYAVGTFKKDTTDPDTVGFIRTKTYTNINIFETGLNSFTLNEPVFTVYDASVYLFCTSSYSVVDDVHECADSKFRLSRLVIKETNVDNNSIYEVTRFPIIVKEPALSEALSTGFNMLLDDPYDFNNAPGTVGIKGIIPYAPQDDPEDPYGEVLLSVNTGATIRAGLVYTYEEGKSHEVKWEYKTPDMDEPRILEDWTAVTVGIDKPIYRDVVTSDPSFTLFANIRIANDPATEEVGVLIYETNNDLIKNTPLSNFDLTTATGMFSHNKMLGLYGVKGAETTVFFSDIENPGYFPFPNNIDYYDEYVLKVINYLDILLVITTNSIYSLTGKGLPNTFVKKKLITNLNITELDASLIKVIKDQVFFKADNTYFVLKPNTYSGDASDLRAYEVSKAVNTFLQNFETNTLDLFNTLYPLRLTEPDLLQNKDTVDVWKYDTLSIKGYTQHVVDGRLQIVIRVLLECTDTNGVQEQRYYFNEADLTIVYDTLTKQWSFQVNQLLNTGALRHRRIDNQTLLYFDNIVQSGKNYLVIAKNTQDPRDFYAIEIQDETGSIQYDKQPSLPNWQLLDTGIVGMTNNLYKRLREFQFALDNTSQERLNFYANVYADGKNILDSVSYTMVHNTDMASADYGHIYMTMEDTVNLEFEGTTALDNWEIDFSKFPDLHLLRNHVLLAGKGRFISGEFINRDEKRYDLSNIIWVYRVMNGR